MLFFMAMESSASFKDLTGELEKGGTLERVASKRNLDFKKVFRISAKAKKEIDRIFKAELNSALETAFRECEDEKKKIVEEN